jgi:hypothetical protein
VAGAHKTGAAGDQPVADIEIAAAEQSEDMIDAGLGQSRGDATGDGGPGFGSQRQLRQLQLPPQAQPPPPEPKSTGAGDSPPPVRANVDTTT